MRHRHDALGLAANRPAHYEFLTVHRIAVLHKYGMEYALGAALLPTHAIARLSDIKSLPTAVDCRRRTTFLLALRYSALRLVR